jgi:hypothetical protein
MVPFVELAPITVAVPSEQMVWLPPALAVGMRSIAKVLLMVVV